MSLNHTIRARVEVFLSELEDECVKTDAGGPAVVCLRWRRAIADGSIVNVETAAELVAALVIALHGDFEGYGSEGWPHQARESFKRAAEAAEIMHDLTVQAWYARAGLLGRAAQKAATVMHTKSKRLKAAKGGAR